MFKNKTYLPYFMMHKNVQEFFYDLPRYFFREPGSKANGIACCVALLYVQFNIEHITAGSYSFAHNNSTTILNIQYPQIH